MNDEQLKNELLSKLHDIAIGVNELGQSIYNDYELYELLEYIQEKFVSREQVVADLEEANRLGFSDGKIYFDEKTSLEHYKKVKVNAIERMDKLKSKYIKEDK